MPPQEITVAGESRVWVAEEGAGPGNVFTYQGCMKIGDTSWPQGDLTRIECPSPDRYNEFVEVAAVQGAQERVSTQLMGRYPRDLSTLLELTRRRCRFDAHVPVGGSAKDLYEIVTLGFAEEAAATVVREVTNIVVCDSVSCGGCEDPSIG